MLFRSDGAADKLKSALLGEAREEARRAFDGERLKLQQEVKGGRDRWRDGRGGWMGGCMCG